MVTLTTNKDALLPVVDTQHLSTYIKVNPPKTLLVRGANFVMYKTLVSQAIPSSVEQLIPILPPSPSVLVPVSPMSVFLPSLRLCVHWGTKKHSMLEPENEPC